MTNATPTGPRRALTALSRSRPYRSTVAIAPEVAAEGPAPPGSPTDHALVGSPPTAGAEPAVGRRVRITRARGATVAATIAVAASLVLHAPGLGRQLFDPDEAAIATMGMVVSRGGVLYRDAIDRKPPIAPWLYGLVFSATGTRDLRYLHGLAALGIAGAALVLASEARRRWGAHAAWWAGGLLLAGAVALSPSDAQAANFSHLALLPACAAIVLARRGTARTAAWGGVLLGVAILTRQSWVLGLAPAVLAAWWHGGRRVGRAALLAASSAASVAAVGLVVPFGPFWHWTFSANTGLLGAAGASQNVDDRFWRAVQAFLVGHLVLCWLVARRGWHRDDLDLWLWVASGLVAFTAGFRFFGHYWLQVLPPLCLLAAPAVVRCTRHARAVLALLVALPTFLLWHLAWSPSELNSRFDAARLARVVESRTSRHDTVAVWGSVPEVYWLSGRRPAGGLVISDFVVGRTAGLPDSPRRLRDATPGARAAYLDALEDRPPKLFLDTSTAGIRHYGHYPPRLIAPLAALLRARYHPVTVVDRVVVYALRSGSPRPSTAAGGAGGSSGPRRR